MAKMKKGVFYTIGFFLLGMVLLGFAIFIAKTNLETVDTVSKISSLNRANEVTISIQEGFKKIFNSKSGILISKGSNFYSFQENLPNNNKNNFTNAIDSYKDFIENRNISINLNVNELKTNLPLKITPHNIIYSHSNFGDSTIIITAESGNFDGYQISVTTNLELDASSCTNSESAQNVYLHLDATGSPGSCTSSSNTISRIDLEDINNNLIATLEVINNDLTITSISQINVKTIIENLADLGKNNLIYSNNLIYLNYQEFNIEKNNTVILL